MHRIFNGLVTVAFAAVTGIVAAWVLMLATFVDANGFFFNADDGSIFGIITTIVGTVLIATMIGFVVGLVHGILPALAVMALWPVTISAAKRPYWVALGSVLSAALAVTGAWVFGRIAPEGVPGLWVLGWLTALTAGIALIVSLIGLTWLSKPRTITRILAAPSAAAQER